MFKIHASPFLPAFLLFLSDPLILSVESVSIHHGHQDFCYEDPGCGPDSDTWAKLCHSGKLQSPININSNETNVTFPSSRYIRMPLGHYKASSFSIRNSGHSVNVQFQPSVGNNNLYFPVKGQGKSPYKFADSHFHWGTTDDCGSEHTIDGKCFTMELHLVHHSAKYGSVIEAITSKEPTALVVIGVLLTATSPTPSTVLAPIVANIGQIKMYSNSTDYLTVQQSLDLTSLFPPIGSIADRIFKGPYVYSYKGSLTTPPCSEQVTWFVFKEPATIAASDAQQFRAISDGEGINLGENHRHVMVTAGRDIDLFIVRDVY